MTVLSTHGLTVRAYSRVLLFDVGMVIPSKGVTCLMGPCAAGKSTLLRAVSWQLQGRGGFRVDGVVRYGDHDVSDGYAPAVVAQQLQQPLLTVFELIVDNLPERAGLRRAEQRELIGERLVALGCAGLAEAMDTQLIDLSLLDARRAAIVRELVADPQLICVDEPCTGLEDDAALTMMRLLEQMAADRPVLWVTHHQARARSLADHVVLLAAGQVVEQLPVEEFFTSPRHRCAQQFVRSGGCDLPSPNASPDEVDESWRDHQVRVAATLLAMEASAAAQDVHRRATPPAGSPAATPPASATDATTRATSAPVAAVTTNPAHEAGASRGRDAELTQEVAAIANDLLRRQSSRPDGGGDREAPRTAATPQTLTRQRREQQHEGAAGLAAVHRAATNTDDSGSRHDGAAHGNQEAGDTGAGSTQSLPRMRHHTPASPDLAPDTQPIRPVTASEDDGPISAGPTGFHWLLTGELAGCPRPGIVDDIDRDLDRIRRTGVSVVVSLTTGSLPEDSLRRAGLRNIHFPIVDMKVPPVEAAIELVRLVERLIHAGHVIVYHCKAGLGRTGTMLVMHLIGRGMTPDEAISFARSRHGMWIQSDEQFAFLRSLPVGFLSSYGHTAPPR